ncbi:MAG: CmcI family methyltransferase [Planctomycetaceae bacterium]
MSTTEEFHQLYYDHACHAGYGRGLHLDTRYHGIETHKCPLDLWVFQEILHDIRPGLVIELGTYLGGTTLFLAHQLELLGTEGHVVSVDHRPLGCPEHERIRYVNGETTAPDVLAGVSEQVAANGRRPVVVIHDADHRCTQVLADLHAYADFVTPGSYLIVEDTQVNGHPVLRGWGDGPMEAVVRFCQERPEFVPDRSREKFLLTYNPSGYLRRAGT